MGKCVFLTDKDFAGNPAKLCRLMHKTKDGLNFELVPCSDVKDCPYKKFSNGLINKSEMEREVEHRRFLACNIEEGVAIMNKIKFELVKDFGGKSDNFELKITVCDKAVQIPVKSSDSYMIESKVSNFVDSLKLDEAYEVSANTVQNNANKDSSDEKLNRAIALLKDSFEVLVDCDTGEDNLVGNVRDFINSVNNQ